MFWWNWNEQSELSINSLKRDMRQPIFMKIKIIPLALLEIAASMYSPFCPIWRIFRPVYHRPSKRANGMILIFMKICCLLSPFNEFYIRLLCSFQFHQNILKYTVNSCYMTEIFCECLLFISDGAIWPFLSDFRDWVPRYVFSSEARKNLNSSSVI